MVYASAAARTLRLYVCPFVHCFALARAFVCADASGAQSVGTCNARSTVAPCVYRDGQLAGSLACTLFILLLLLYPFSVSNFIRRRQQLTLRELGRPTAVWYTHDNYSYTGAMADTASSTCTNPKDALSSLRLSTVLQFLVSRSSVVTFPSILTAFTHNSEHAALGSTCRSPPTAARSRSRIDARACARHQVVDCSRTGTAA